MFVKFENCNNFITQIPQPQNRLKLIWVACVGNVLARHSSPTSLEGDVISIVCDNPIWSQEILLLQTKIIQNINEKLKNIPNQTQVRKMRCRVGRPSDLRLRARQTDKPRMKLENLPLERQQAILQAVSAIADDNLRQKTARLYCLTEMRQVAMLKNGAHLCCVCRFPTFEGVPDPQYRDNNSLPVPLICPSCLRRRHNAQRSRNRSIIAEYLDNTPWITWENIQKDHPFLQERSLFVEMRDQMAYELRRGVWEQMKQMQPGQPLPPQMRLDLIVLTALLSQKMPQDYNPKLIKRVLGPMLGTALIDNRACKSRFSKEPED